MAPGYTTPTRGHTVNPERAPARAADRPIEGRGWALLGVPSSSTAHGPGQEQAPAALRADGLVDVPARLDTAGLDPASLDLVDLGDVTCHRWQPDPSTAKNLEAALATFDGVMKRGAQVRRDGRRPLVIGGECTVELGVLAGHLAAGGDPALLYVDVDLYPPATNPNGALDSMTVAHALALPGTNDRLARHGPAPRCSPHGRWCSSASPPTPAPKPTRSTGSTPAASRPPPSPAVQQQPPPRHSPLFPPPPAS